MLEVIHGYDIHLFRQTLYTQQTLNNNVQNTTTHNVNITLHSPQDQSLFEGLISVKKKQLYALSGGTVLSFRVPLYFWQEFLLPCLPYSAALSGYGLNYTEPEKQKSDLVASRPRAVCWPTLAQWLLGTPGMHLCPYL